MLNHLERYLMPYKMNCPCSHSCKHSYQLHKITSVMGEGNVEHNGQKYENMNSEYSKSNEHFSIFIWLDFVRNDFVSYRQIEPDITVTRSF